MNTTHASAGSRELRNGGPFNHRPAVSISPPATCRMAATGACFVSDLCNRAKDDSLQPLSIDDVPRRTIRRGEFLYRAGDTLVNLYQLYAGSVKLRITNCAGIEQIASFPMAGALLGLDGIETGKYTCDAIALEDSLVCTLPFSDLVARSGTDATAALRLNKAIAKETSSYRRLLMVLACMNSEERIASFLVDISERMAAGGYSSREFVLKMTREDIARHLGMTIETVSRAFTRLQISRVLDVSRRRLSIRDPDALRRLGTSH